MFWFWVPVAIVAIVIVAIVAVLYSRRAGGTGVRQPGDTVYDEHQQQRQKAPNAPPA